MNGTVQYNAVQCRAVQCSSKREGRGMLSRVILSKQLHFTEARVTGHETTLCFVRKTFFKYLFSFWTPYETESTTVRTRLFLQFGRKRRSLRFV